jgi:hypothetical protein
LATCGVGDLAVAGQAITAELLAHPRLLSCDGATDITADDASSRA